MQNTVPLIIDTGGQPESQYLYFHRITHTDSAKPVLPLSDRLIYLHFSTTD